MQRGEAWGVMRKMWSRVAVRTFILILICVLPLNLFAIVRTFQGARQIEYQVGQSMQNVSDVYMSTLDAEMDNVDNMLYDLAYNNPDMQVLFSGKEDAAYVTSKQKLFVRMGDILAMDYCGDGYYIYLKESDDIIMRYATNTVNYSDGFRKYLSSLGADVHCRKWIRATVDGNEWLIRVIRRNNAVYGSVINLSEIQRTLQRELTGQTQSLWFSEGEQPPQKKYLCVSSVSSKAELALNISMAESEIVRNLSGTEKGAVVLAFVFLAMIPVLYFYFRKTLLEPISLLNRAHVQFQTDPGYRIAESANTEELREAFLTYNQMAENIQKLKLENMEKELDKNRMELNNLQLQIRPHFLLNMFNLIYVLAERREFGSVRRIILYLSDYFRYIYRDGRELEIFDKEIRLIDGYREAVSIRYPGMVEIVYQIEPEIHMLRLPPLLIHNFIENSVKHAMVQGQVLHIVLEGIYEGGKDYETIYSGGTYRCDGSGAAQRLRWFRGSGLGKCKQLAGRRECSRFGRRQLRGGLQCCDAVAFAGGYTGRT